MRLSKELEEKRQGLLRYCKIGEPTHFIGPGVVRGCDLEALLSEIDRLNKVVEEAVALGDLSYSARGNLLKANYIRTVAAESYPSLAAELEARKEEE